MNLTAENTKSAKRKSLFYAVSAFFEVNPWPLRYLRSLLLKFLNRFEFLGDHFYDNRNSRHPRRAHPIRHLAVEAPRRQN